MRLFQAIIDANHRALAGDPNAGLHPAEFADELPIVALSCIDPRLNPLLPSVLGIPQECFIWLRNAGNIISGPLSSTMRSLALACAIKGGKEIVIIGHTDCLVGKTSTSELLDKLRAQGVARHLLPDNVNEYFGMFASPRGNVLKAVEIARHSPLIGSKIPVQGLLVDTETGKLEWLVNGYQALDTLASRADETTISAGHPLDALKSLADFQIGEMKFPETKIGETAVQAEDWLGEKIRGLEERAPSSTPAAKPVVPPRIPLPPAIRPEIQLRKRPK
jgi:carbonic anhydrase